VRGLRDWITYRLLGRCPARGCGRLTLLHTPRRLRRCEHEPLAVELTEAGRLAGNAVEPESANRRIS
jgi:hypothetical protein